jgi:hypothetical protein
MLRLWPLALLTLSGPAPAQDRPEPMTASFAPPTASEIRRSNRLTARRYRRLRTIYEEPLLETDRVDGHTEMLARNAVIAQQHYTIHLLRLKLDADVTVGAPFHLRLGQGEELRAFAGDPDRAHCLSRRPEPRDEAGMIYPDICLIDRDGDSLAETIRFVPEDIDDPARVHSIAPVALTRLPPGWERGIGTQSATQRLRVERIDSRRAYIVVESQIVPAALSIGGPWFVRSKAGSRTSLRLKEGATAHIAGVMLRAGRDSRGAWQVTTKGRFDDWLFLREGNTLIDAGTRFYNGF